MKLLMILFLLILPGSGSYIFNAEKHDHASLPSHPDRPTQSNTQSCWGSFRGDQALTGTSRSRLPKDLKLLWRFKTGSEIKSSPVACNNAIVVGSADGYIYALDLSGRLIWKDSTGNGIEAPALILGKTVYTGNLSGDLIANNLADGKRMWTYKTDGQISGAPNFWTSRNSTRILVGSYDYFLHCVDAATGKGLWKYESDNFINGAAACIDGKAVFGGCDGFLHLVDIETGKMIDKINVATYVPGSTPVSNGLAFVGDYDGGFSCVSFENRKISWKYANPKSQLPFLASAALLGNRVVTGSRDKHVYCFAAADGNMLWKYNTGERVDASPVICGDIVIAANMRGDLILLRLDDGTPVWSYQTGSAINGNPAVLDDKIILAAENGNIYCFGQ